MLTQREHDIARLEAELKMQALYNEWKRSFLAERLVAKLEQMQPQQQAATMMPQAPPPTLE